MKIEKAEIKQVYQTIFTRSRGNCLQAAVASLLGKELDEVPRFPPLEYPRAMMKYLFEQGIVVMSVQTTGDAHLRAVFERLAYEGVCLVCVQSFLFEMCSHAVVGVIENGTLTLIHDPNPDNRGRRSEDYKIMEIHFLY